jgi:hypothetical protein
MARARQATRPTGRLNERVARYNVHEVRQAAHKELQQLAATWTAWNLQAVAHRGMEVRAVASSMHGWCAVLPACCCWVLRLMIMLLLVACDD